MDSYVITDRTTLGNIKISIVDDEFLFESTTDLASEEPVIIDEIDLTHKKFFISDGEWAIESTSDPFVEILVLTDTVTGINKRFVVRDGEFGFFPTTRIPRFRNTKINRPFISAKHRILS